MISLSKISFRNSNRRFNWKKISIFVAILLSCNLLAGIAFFTSSQFEPSVLGVVSGKEGYKLRFSTTTNGALTFTGNSLCLSDSQAQGTCGTFITTDTSLSDSPYGDGTTNDWTKNSSKAVLNIPDGGEILYAELIWGGSYKYTTQDLTPVLDRGVTFITPKGEYKIKPDPATDAEVSESSAYVRTADVTSLISKDGSGTYILGAVPATIDRTNPYNNYAGWTLAVAYRDINQPARNLSIFVSAEQVGPDQMTNIAEVKGFATPTDGNVSGRLLVSAQEGDPCYSGDQMRFGQSPSSLTTLSGPNNRSSNFFASQINGEDGKLNTSGSFGQNNQSTGSCSNARRQGWDITNVDISSLLTTNQTTAYAQGTSKGDVYMINALGMQIDVNAAKPEVSLSVDKKEAKIGDTLTYTSTITNTGSADSNNSLFSGLIPDGTSFVVGSLTVDGKNTETQNADIDLQTIKSDQIVIVTYQVKIESVSANQKFVNQVNLNYQYNMVTGEPAIKDKTQSNEVITTYNENPNTPPLAKDDNSSTQYITPVTIDVLSNDVDPENNINPNSLSVIKNPNNGTTIISKNKIIYSPAIDFSGTDTFEYEICDDAGACDKAIVTVEISPKPVEEKPLIEPEVLPPTAKDDTGSTSVNQSTTISILTNDVFNDGDPKNTILTIENNPLNGKASFDTDGKLIYTPNQDFSGEDKLTYKLCDQTKLCATASVSIEVIDASNPNPNPTTNTSTNNSNNVSPNTDKNAGNTTTQTGDKSNSGNSNSEKGTVISFANHPKPIAKDDQAKTDINVKVTIPVSANDVVSGDVLDLNTVKIISNAKHGTVITNQNNGNVEYVPNIGYIGSDSFTYQICTNHNQCDEAIVTVTTQERLTEATTKPANQQDIALNNQDNTNKNPEADKNTLIQEKTEAKIGSQIAETVDQPEYPVSDSNQTTIVDKQGVADELTKNPNRGQILGVFENTKLIRTGGEYGIKIILPMNIILILIIFALNRIADTKESKNTQIYD